MPYIELRGISKHFGAVQANDNVSIDIEKRRILALLGENGSGKSTLLNILSGVYSPDSGVIRINGREARFTSPADALRAGICMVHQHFMLVPVMSALENIALGGQARGLFIDKKRIISKIEAISERFSLKIDYNKKVYDMSVGEKQRLEIIKALYHGAGTLILDEPTAVLAPQEARDLFAVMRSMKEAGAALVIITHKLREVFEISDSITVLRGGRVAGSVETKDADVHSLALMMVGGEKSLEIERASSKKSVKPVLEVRDLCFKDSLGRFLLKNLDFSLYGGEILGVAGIAGSGQRELCECIAGLCRPSSGSIRFLGEEIAGLSPRALKKRGLRLAFVPEDRLGMGLAGGMDIVSNVLLRSYDEGATSMLDIARGARRAEGIVLKYGISTPSARHIVRKLSGGNIQKVLLGRELEWEPALLVCAYPARGLDIGAAGAVYNLLNEQKKRNCAVLFVGEDLDVLLALCDRVMVLAAGALRGVVDAASAVKEDVGRLMLG